MACLSAPSLVPFLCLPPPSSPHPSLPPSPSDGCIDVTHYNIIVDLCTADKADCTQKTHHASLTGSDTLYIRIPTYPLKSLLHFPPLNILTVKNKSHIIMLSPLPPPHNSHKYRLSRTQWGQLFKETPHTEVLYHPCTQHLHKPSILQSTHTHDT